MDKYAVKLFQSLQNLKVTEENKDEIEKIKTDIKNKDYKSALERIEAMQKKENEEKKNKDSKENNTSKKRGRKKTEKTEEKTIEKVEDNDNKNDDENIDEDLEENIEKDNETIENDDSEDFDVEDNFLSSEDTNYNEENDYQEDEDNFDDDTDYNDEDNIDDEFNDETDDDEDIDNSDSENTDNQEKKEDSIYPENLRNKDLEQEYLGLMLNNPKLITKYYILNKQCYFEDNKLTEIYKSVLFTEGSKYTPEIAKDGFNLPKYTNEIRELKDDLMAEYKEEDYDIEKIYVELRKLFELRKSYLETPIKENQDKIVEITNYVLYDSMSVEEVESAINQVTVTGKFKQSILNRDLTLQSAGFPLPSVSERLVMSCKLYKIFPSFVSKYFFPKGTPYKIHGNIPMRECGWVSGACMLVRKKEYLECGGLNENLIFYGEEPEFGYRACKLGYKTLYNPNFYIIHLGGQSVKKENKKHNDDIIRFERYSRLQEETVGYKKAIVMSQVVVAVLYFKGLFYKNKSQIKEFIRYEKSLIKYMKLKNEETINRH